MTNDEIRTLPVVNPDDAERQHVCVPVADLARVLLDADAFVSMCDALANPRPAPLTADDVRRIVREETIRAQGEWMDAMIDAVLTEPDDMQRQRTLRMTRAAQRSLDGRSGSR